MDMHNAHAHAHAHALHMHNTQAGAFTVGELKAALSVDVRTLRQLGFTPLEMKDGDVTAEELKPLGYTAAEMRAGSYTTPELKSAG